LNPRPLAQDFRSQDIIGFIEGECSRSQRGGRREELMKSMRKKANELIVAYESERGKRSKFQYDIGVQAKRGYAQTSLERAKEFVFEISKIVKS
jgi:hypothetical protein